ncbi:MAG: hypothetical protein RLP44_20595 [Aggregatilineales bacterium]
MKKLAILLIILSLALAACGGGDSDSDADAENANPTEQPTSVTTEEATEEAPAETDATEEAVMTEEADMTEEAMEQSADEDATEEAMEETVDEDATEEAMEEAMDADATEEADATDEGSDVIASGPVVISGFESLEEGCPTLFQFQYPPSWTILRSGGARVTFEIATDSGVSEGLIEYRGGVAPNQIETNYQRVADLDTTTLIYTLVFDGQEYPVYKDDRTTNSGPVNYYYFFLPGRNLADNVRMTIQPTDSGDFPPDEEMIQVFSTVVPNSCF